MLYLYRIFSFPLKVFGIQIRSIPTWDVLEPDISLGDVL